MKLPDILYCQKVSDGLTWGAPVTSTKLLMLRPSPADMDNPGAAAALDYTEVTGIVATSEPGSPQIDELFIFEQMNGDTINQRKGVTGIIRCVAALAEKVSAGTATIRISKVTFDIGVVDTDGTTFTSKGTINATPDYASTSTTYENESAQGFINCDAASFDVTLTKRLALRIRVYAYLTVRPGAETGDIRLRHERGSAQTYAELYVQ